MHMTPTGGPDPADQQRTAVAGQVRDPDAARPDHCPGAPPVPVRLTGRPVVGGLAVPWISFHHADGTAVLGVVDAGRQALCLTLRRCQACGQPLTSPLVLFARARDVAAGYITEPALHPECAAYSAVACPMLSGTMRRYRSAPRPPRQERCGNPQCDCRAWKPDADSIYRAGHAAEDFAAIWIRLRDYRLGTHPGTDQPRGVALTGTRILRIRPLASPATHETGASPTEVFRLLELINSLGLGSDPDPGRAAAEAGLRESLAPHSPGGGCGGG